MEALAEYSGQAVCRNVLLSWNTAARYNEELRAWAWSTNWRVAQDEDAIFQIQIFFTKGVPTKPKKLFK